MSHDISIDELQNTIAPLKGYVGRKIQHRKTLGWYRIIGLQFREADLSIEFTYETCHRDPVRFSRPIVELLDGRFQIGE